MWETSLPLISNGRPSFRATFACVVAGALIYWTILQIRTLTNCKVELVSSTHVKIFLYSYQTLRIVICLSNFLIYIFLTKLLCDTNVTIWWLKTIRDESYGRCVRSSAFTLQNIPHFAADNFYYNIFSFNWNVDEIFTLKQNGIDWYNGLVPIREQVIIWIHDDLISCLTCATRPHRVKTILPRPHHAYLRHWSEPVARPGSFDSEA